MAELSSLLAATLLRHARRPFSTVFVQQGKLSERTLVLDQRSDPTKRQLLDLQSLRQRTGRPTGEEVEAGRRIRACSEAGDWRGALAALRAQASPSHFLCATALDACTKALRAKEAEELWHQMPTCDHGPARVATFNMMIKLQRNLRRVSEAERLFAQMKSEGLEPTIITYVEMIQAHGYAGNWEEASKLFEQVRSLPQWAEASMKSKQVAFVAALSACARVGRYLKARGLFEEMRREGISAVHSHYNSLMTACASEADAVTAQAAFVEMTTAGLEPRSEDYTSLIQCNRKDHRRTEALLAEMRGKGLKPTRLTLEAVAQAAFEAGQAVRALELLADAKATCKMPASRKSLELEEQARAAIQGRVASAASGAAASSAAAGEGAALLPEGWASALDPSSGVPYFWRQADPEGSVTWNRPR